MSYPAFCRSLAVATVFTLVVTLALFIPNVSANDGDDIQSEKTQLTYPNLSTHLNRLAEGYGTGRMSQREAAGEAPVHSGGSVAVTVYLDGHVSEIVSFLQGNGGDVRNVGEDYIEAYVPVGVLGQLSLQPGVTWVWEIIPPQAGYGNVTSQGVALHLADSWQEAGYQGQGVKVGVIDVGFTGYSDLMGVELPANVEARCYTDVGVYTSNLADCEASEPLPDFNQCSRGESGSVHGTAVAEAVIDIAPHATLYISQPGSWGDLRETAAWMAEQGVQVINYSVGWTHYGSRGDGTSPYSSSPLNTVDRAVDNGITWVNAAGNSAEDTWFGSFSDHDGDGEMSFTSTGAEINSITLLECQRYIFQLRWEDSWGGADTDLDMYLYDRSTGDVLDIPREWGIVGSEYEQSGALYHEPFEFIVIRSPIDSMDVGVKVVHYSGPEPDWVQLEMFVGRGGLQYFSDGGSIGNPAESANPGLLAVGAAPYFNTQNVEFFSSRGPTPDGRIKPDIVGIDCAASVSYGRRNFRGNTCWFPGTSQASPHVAGMAALVRQRFPDFTAEETATYLKNNAEPRGAVPNNTWGYGLAQLAPTAVGGCFHELTGDGTTNGQWSPKCQSLALSRGFSQFYSFILEEESAVTIDLESEFDTYLYLRQGTATSGDVLYLNDDAEDIGVSFNSRIVSTLPAATYTIEATTYDPVQTGSFVLTVSGLGTTAAQPDRGATISATPISGPPGTLVTLTGGGFDIYVPIQSVRVGAIEVTPVPRPATDSTGMIDFAIVIPGSDVGVQTIEVLAGDIAASTDFTVTGTGTSTLADSCGQVLTADGATIGTWASDCQSQVASRGYARYFVFTLEQRQVVTISLESEVDTYLYLRRGNATSGDSLFKNDDIEAGGVNLNSRISETLAVGTYTIEATTYSANQVGSFTLTLAGLSGPRTDPGQDPGPSSPDPCVSTTIHRDGSTDGTWGSDCQSSVSSRGYARYYTFTLDQQSRVTVTLESEVDTFLYLRSGGAQAGDALYRNDDIEAGGLNLNSRITASLPAATYTIEATTYAADQAGRFTLIISGLTGDDGVQPETVLGDMETSRCSVTTIEVDGTTMGAWASDCQSQVPARGYARYYSFTLDQASAVSILLESDIDTFLFLWAGEAHSVTLLYANDDIENGGLNLNSRISEILSAGTYTIEATTYYEERTGSFNLTVAGL